MKPIVLIGPTASGKTELALALAKQLHSHIISADSRQVYQQLTVGTAKPKGAWQNGTYFVEQIPYHLVDFLAPDQTFDVSAFCKQASALLAAEKDKPAVIAGGTGMYIHAFFVGLDPLPPSDPSLRAELTAWAAAHGKEDLHQRLAEKDPLSAKQIPAGNIQRVMRALEISLLAGQPASALRKGTFHQPFPTEKALLVYLNWEKEILEQRIAQRTEGMLEPMAAETKALLEKGFSPACAGLKSLGYPEILAWLNGTLSRQETLEQIMLRTRQYAKRQRTWFNRYTEALRIDLPSLQAWNLPALAARILTAYEQSLN